MTGLEAEREFMDQDAPLYKTIDALPFSSLMR